MTAFDVIGLGFSSLDTVGLVPHLPRLDEGAPLLGLTRQGGGPVAQALVTLARLGVKVGFIGRVGDDDAGETMRRDLAAEGVDTSRLQVEPGATSPQCIILVDQPTGKRSICCSGGTVSPIPSTIDGAYASSGRFLHLDGHSPEAARAAATAARAAGVTVCLDAGGPEAHLRELVPLTDVLIAAERFARALAPDGTVERGAADLLTMGPRIVVVTCGERGAYTRTAEREVVTPALAVPVVDTTGAGDVFHGGFLYGLLQGWELARTAEFAAATAALKCTQLGGRAGIPRRSEVEAFLHRHARTDGWSAARDGPLPIPANESVRI